MRCAHGRSRRLPRRRSRRGSAAAPATYAPPRSRRCARSISAAASASPRSTRCSRSSGRCWSTSSSSRRRRWPERLRDDGLAAAVAGHPRAPRRRRARAGLVVRSAAARPLSPARAAACRPASCSRTIRRAPGARRGRRRSLRPTALHPESLLVDARAVAAGARAATPSTSGPSTIPAELRLLRALGVDGVITNRPGTCARRVTVLTMSERPPRGLHRGDQRHADRCASLATSRDPSARVSW